MNSSSQQSVPLVSETPSMPAPEAQTEIGVLTLTPTATQALPEPVSLDDDSELVSRIITSTPTPADSGQLSTSVSGRSALTPSSPAAIQAPIEPTSATPNSSEDASVSVSGAMMLPTTLTNTGDLTSASPDDDSEAEIDSEATPSPVAQFVSRLQGEDVDVVENALVRFKEACREGDHSYVQEALIEQVTLLNALGLKLLGNAGAATSMPGITLCTNLGLRSIELARKSLETLISARGRGNRQTNVQVNLGTPPNEFLEVPRGS